MKPFIIVTFILSVFLRIQAQPVRTYGMLSVDGVNLVDQKGNPVILHGVSYGWHNWWPRFYNEESVAWLAGDWKVNVVRAAMGVEPDSGYLKSPEWSLDKIEAVIWSAIQNDIYVIIDWHAHGIHLEAAKEFFALMAAKYGEYPHIIYEIFNEPVRDSWEDIKAYSVEVIKAIRDIDPDNIILVGNPHWAQDVHIVADDPIMGFDNLMYSLHYYAGTHGQFLRDRGDYALGKGIPLFVSEAGGMEASGNGPINYDEWNKWIKWMNDNKISRVYWSIADKNESCSMMKKTAGSEGNWKEEDLKEWGIRVREEISGAE